MKQPILTRWLVMLGVLAWLVSCKPEADFRPLDTFFHYQRITEIAIDTTVQKDFIAGIDRIDVPLALLYAKDADGNRIDLPDHLVQYLWEEVPLPDNHFRFTERGTYAIRAKFGQVLSAPVTFRVHGHQDIKLRLSVDYQRAGQPYHGTYVADSLTTARFSIGAWIGNKPIQDRSGARLYVNDSPLPDTLFTTRHPGLYTFKVRWQSIESNAIVLDARSPVKRLVIDLGLDARYFYADGKTRLTVELTALDENDRPMRPTPDLTLTQNGVNIPSGSVLSTQEVRAFTFRATGYGLTNQQVTINSVRDETFRVVRLPVIFHVNTSAYPAFTEKKVADMLAQVTQIYRGQYGVERPRAFNSADAYVEFYAAETDPAGRPLPQKGIDAVPLPQRKYTYYKSEDMKVLTDEAWKYYWNPDYYLNVWVTQIEEGFSFAYFPAWSTNLEGTSSYTKPEQPNYTFGTFFNYDHTAGVLAHELGHNLALDHVFSGAGYELNGCSATDPDECDDTPYYDRTAYQASMGSNPYQRTACDGTHFISSNVMDYFHTYENSFTRDQRRRMRHTLDKAYWLPTRFNNPNAPNGRAGLRVPNGYIQKPSQTVNMKRAI
ncbi:hypothetical protein GCM10027275_18020 [Rhabdobacter roseus]|uniref:Peptidase M43 pregnancy-associated plasma-A domain-containing protein n=1 Tax=Rhabdobacter roseus TaxID=1655419 RepID=A0A840TR62_9BACT|nr:M43 family zinc metalloprotease [Rhabdobacter roseus]MBB5283723.1 hypothetical protein [Rhabdobacter roseus]